MTNGWATTTDWGGMVGIAKDGHPIYGPYNASGEAWTCSERDVCNGVFFSDTNYGYAATKTHPYVLGCWGPAASQTYAQTCSKYACGDTAW